MLKQMRLLHTKGFSSSERKQWKVTIFNNLLHAFQVIFGAMEEQEVDFAHETNIVRRCTPLGHKKSYTDIHRSASQRSSLQTPRLAQRTPCHWTA